MHRGLPAGQPEIFQVAGPPPGAVPESQEFPAPDPAVRAVTGPVEDGGQERTFQLMLRGRAESVRCVMLHLDLFAGKRAGQGGGGV